MMQKRKDRQLNDPGPYVAPAWVVVAFLFLSWALAACQSVEQPVAHDRLVRFFDDLVFGTDYALDSERPKNILKWTETVRVKITGDDAQNHRADVKAQLEQVSKLTRIDVRLSEPQSAQANYEVRFVPIKDFLVNREYVPCYVNTRSESGIFEEVRIVISTENPALIRRCIAHEIMHSFGFGKHSAIISSILSPLHAGEDLTPWDEMVLRTLYDSRLRPGMTRKQAMPVADQILKDLLSRTFVAQRSGE